MLFSTVVALEYIVQYHPDVEVDADVTIGDFKVSFVTQEKARKMFKNESVKRIVKNTLKHVFIEEETQATPSSWGIDRIDSRTGLDKKYVYPASAGEGTTAYIIDTGINVEHEDFEGRATFGFDATGQGLSDGHGHGTHVAGTVAGKAYGVAKKANLVAVRVLNSQGSGDDEGIIKGLEFVVKDSKAKKTKATINMSIGGEQTDLLDDAVNAVVAQGVVVVVAAGNESGDACNSSPAAAWSAITVGATDRTDRAASFTNYGKCVDISGPGVGITSAWKGGSTATRTISGTSMASPHVCGVANLYLGLGVANVTATMLANASADKIKGLKSSTPNLLVFNALKTESDDAPVDEEEQSFVPTTFNKYGSLSAPAQEDAAVHKPKYNSRYNRYRYNQ